ncbi:MAG: sucrose-6-phosphate hydrolase [Sphingomonadales bacterium]|nr:sucrose-6-phosphate hydrolase [Sphingomonadales bacterium]NCQ20676.1 sucrose-6-phosphate hydrolase [Sphingomonadales bacterium]NCT04811.1 sucrose-6-phosphate hydrolase [Sphingomonadales bacterium]
MTTRPLILADLDDSLFQTRAKCGDWPDSSLKPMSRLVDGSPSGYATPPQQALLAWLARGELVPVTARSRAVMARVDIAQAPAICANGGCILTAEGTPDPVWHGHLATLAQGAAAPSALYPELTGGLDTEAFRHWIVSEGGLDLYIVIKSNHGDEPALATVAEALAPRLPQDWRIHANGNNLAFLPPWLSKRAAVRYMLGAVRAETPERLVIGIGDSWSDTGFLDLADMAMIPTQAQLWQHIARGNEWVD